MKTEITVAEYLALTKGRSKYGNRKVEVDGVEFDSLAESRRYKELLLLEEGGLIEDLTCHPRYILQPAFRDLQGRKHREIVYEADFRYIEIIDPNSSMGRCVVEDVKGGKATQTQAFRLKEKLFRYKYPNLDLRLIEQPKAAAGGAAARGVEPC